MDASHDPPSEPAGADPYAYFAARGVTRGALLAFFEGKAERSAGSHDSDGSPLAELYHALGLDWTVTLIASLGGMEVYVPASTDIAARNWPDLPAGLCEVFAHHYSGSRVCVPTLYQVFAECRRDRIVQRRADGLTNNAVARELGVTARYVREILADAARADIVIDDGASQRRAAIDHRNEQIVQRRSLGLTLDAIAREFGLAPGHVGHIVRSAAAATKAAASC